MSVDITRPTDNDTLSAQELALYTLLMDYRAELGLAAIPLSQGLTVTAGRHAVDTYENIWQAGVTLPEGHTRSLLAQANRILQTAVWLGIHANSF